MARRGTISQIVTITMPPPIYEAGDSIAAVIVRWIVSCVEKRASRRALSRLSDAQLQDIGVTREEARIEWQRPFWR